MARVVVVGSINADLVVSVARLPRAGETVTGGRFARHGGGKGANQAVAAARLGASTALVGAVGSDDLGDEALRELAAEGVDVSAVARRDEPTGVALIVVDEAGENQIAVASGANAALDGDEVAAALERLLAPAAAAAPHDSSPAGPHDSSPAAPHDSSPAAAPHDSAAAYDVSPPAGVVLLGNEVRDAAVLAGAHAARAAGWLAVLNPAPARPLPDGLGSVVLTPNADEARELAGVDDVEAAGLALAARTGVPVLVTLGAQGALLVDGGAERLPAREVQPVDTTGAGDAFNGALAAELAEGRPLREAARFALAAAALSTRAPGARAGMPRRDEVG